MDALRAKALRPVVKRLRRSSGRRSLSSGKRKRISQDGTPFKPPHISPTRSLPKEQDAEHVKTGCKRKSLLDDGLSRKKPAICIDEQSPTKPAQGPAQVAMNKDASQGTQPAVEVPQGPLPNFSAGIPLEAHVLTPTVRDLELWIRGGPGSLAVLAARPALGSSSAVRKAAELAGAAYVRVPGAANLRIDEMVSDCAEKVVQMTDAGPVQVATVEAALQLITDAAVAGLLWDVREKLATPQEEGPGAASSNLIWMAEETEAGGSAKDLGVLGNVVVHIDEVGESLGVSQEKTAKGGDRANRSDWQVYSSCALGKSLTAACSEVHNLRVALSVRLSSQVHTLSLPPCISQASIAPVCAAAPELVEPVLRWYLQGRVDDATLQGLSEQLAGPFRLMEKFLTEVRLRAEQPLTVGVLKECIERSYSHLRVELLVELDLHWQKDKGLLDAMRTLWKKARCTRKTRSSTEGRKQVASQSIHLRGILACGLLPLKVLHDGNFIVGEQPSAFFSYMLDNL